MTPQASHTPYGLAQRALADLKTAIYIELRDAGSAGRTNVALGRSLGIYHGHKGHEGHIPRTLLAMMQVEGVVEQIPDSKAWRLRITEPLESGDADAGQADA